MDRTSEAKIGMAFRPRMLVILMTLLAIHSLLPQPSLHPSSSSSSTSSFSSSWWGWSWLDWIPSPRLSIYPAAAAAAAAAMAVSSAEADEEEASRMACVMNRQHQHLTQMLNELQTMDDLDPGRLALQTMWMRDNHSLGDACPAVRLRGSAPSRLSALERQSLCPWTLVQNNHTNRIPRLLWFARCLCGRCLSFESSPSSPSLYTCVPLYHRVSVIWEVCQAGEMHYRWGTESVPVGCVCAHPSARQIP